MPAQPTAPTQDTHADGLAAFVDACPSPFHVTAHVASLLEQHGFTRLAETDRWPTEAGRYVVLRAGSLVAWSNEHATGPATPFRVVGGHTDSPNLRVVQHPDLAHVGWQVVGLQPYGGALLNSWLDRELGLSGRVTVRDPHAPGGSRECLLRVDDPILRVPQLAIHLAEDRAGVRLDPQRHVDAVWGIGGRPHSFVSYVADLLEVTPDAVLGWELMTHDLVPSTVFGRESDLLAAPRLDNQTTCYAGLRALVDALHAPTEGVVPLLVLFDHEEVGSMSDRGAQSDLLPTALERVVHAGGGDREDLLRALAGSVIASGDMAHATHPLHPERHEPSHQVLVGGGPVLKVHPNLRYATDAAGTAVFALACEQAGVPLQRYMHRADLPCGSTVGPFTAAGTGVTTVDVGAPQLAMHAAREMMGADDVASYVYALTAFLAPDRI